MNSVSGEIKAVAGKHEKKLHIHDNPGVLTTAVQRKFIAGLFVGVNMFEDGRCRWDIKFCTNMYFNYLIETCRYVNNIVVVCIMTQAFY